MGGHSRDFIDSRNLNPGLQLASLSRSEPAGEIIPQNSDTDRLRDHARPKALRQRTQRIEATNATDSSIAHDFNNVLQTAISSLDLMQVRVKQGRTAEILPLIEKAQMALCRAGLMTRAAPMDVRQ
jgi:hypothetical protein